MEDTATSSKPANGVAQADRGTLASHGTASLLHDPAVVAALLRWLEDGRTLSTFCKEHHVARRTCYDHMQRDPAFREKVEQARRIGEGAILDEMIAIADTPSTHRDDVAHRKLQLWMRERRLIWSNPQVYGQKQQIQQTVQHRVELSDTERDIRIKQLLAKAEDKTPQLDVEVHEDEPSDAER